MALIFFVEPELEPEAVTNDLCAFKWRKGIFVALTTDKIGNYLVKITNWHSTYHGGWAISLYIVLLPIIQIIVKSYLLQFKKNLYV